MDVGQISWSTRLGEVVVLNGKLIHVSVDGTDCPINEPRPFNRTRFSHKFHGAGVRYEIVLLAEYARIFWVNGPFEGGSNPDDKIFVGTMKKKLTARGKVIADKGYNDIFCVSSTNIVGKDRGLHMRIHARHEVVNERIKKFNVLRHTFRHNVNLHVHCFHAVCDITAIMLDTTDKLFSL